MNNVLCLFYKVFIKHLVLSDLSIQYLQQFSKSEFKFQLTYEFKIESI